MNCSVLVINLWEAEHKQTFKGGKILSFPSQEQFPDIINHKVVVGGNVWETFAAFFCLETNI